MTPFEEGWNEVYQSLGLLKVALVIPPGTVARAGQAGKSLVEAGAKQPWHTSLRKFMIGEPINFGKEIMSGNAFKRDSMMHQGMKAPKMLDKALLYGLPAYMGYQTMKSDAPDKAQSIGGLALGTLGTNALYRPLGMVGSMVAYPVLDRIGRGAVNVAQKATGTFGQSDPQNPYQRFQQRNPQGQPQPQYQGRQF
jgi:hypothetical protein